MTRRKRRDLSVFSLSFLDCISCGFGAVILLFVISLGSERLVIVDIRDTLEKLYQERIAELASIQAKNKNFIKLIQHESEKEEDKLERVKSMQTQIDELINAIKEAEYGQKALVVDVDQMEKALDARERENRDSSKRIRPADRSAGREQPSYLCHRHLGKYA